MTAQTATGNGHQDAAARPDVDAVVVGAGFAGLYLLARLRELGFSARVLESADDVGGTWYWNRYPGARCDIQSVDYSYSWDPELEEQWEWSEKYAPQPEILRYLDFVATKHDLRRDITFETRVEEATWDEVTGLWRVRTSGGEEISCRFYIMATGCLSLPKEPDIEGTARFQGPSYYTGRWPKDGVDFTGKRVAVIGTGSSAIQSIPIIAQQASQLTVYQRTPNFSMPAHNGPVPADKRATWQEDPKAYRAEARYTRGGVPGEVTMLSAVRSTEEERQARFEEAWEAGELFASLGAFADILTNEQANEYLCEFVRQKIREIVKDPATAEALSPRNHYYGTKRPCLDTGYYATYNLPHVDLVDLRKDPIVTITEGGIQTQSGERPFDVIVFATGFDAMTGAIVSVDITGRDGVTLKEKWAHGPQTYLGLTVQGFPNFFAITGPGSPSVLSNMAVSIEQHVEWVTDTMAHLRDAGFDTIEATPLAEEAWGVHVNDCADITLYPTANSWYMGANVPGKPRVFLPYVGGVDVYRRTCEAVAAQGYLGFELRGPAGTQCNDGVVNRLQPDVAAMLDMMGQLELPPIESLPVDQARMFYAAMSAERPPGPDVGEIVDGTYPAAAGDLAYRLYRPATPGPHAMVVYFHGGGWVFGSADSDDPFCRDLCVKTDSVVVSVDYRHTPETRFPGAAEDAVAAVRWAAANAEALGAAPGRLAVAGWSAGANLAAVVCQLLRDEGGPRIDAQLLLNPVTDSDFTRSSYVDNADGYILTKGVMEWFWGHYTDEAQRTDPRVAPLRAADLSGLPPAVVATCEFDPLRDEGDAYAAALAAAGVPVEHVPCHGQVHTSLTSVDMVLSGGPMRADILQRFKGLLGTPVPA